MNKKNVKQQNSAINYQVNVNIDYEKLAQSIISARRKENELERKTSRKSIRARILSFLNGCIYLCVTFLSFQGVYYLWQSQTITYSNQIVLTVLFGVLALISFLFQQESLDETKEEAHKYFETNVSLIALIISLIALFCEVYK